MLRILLLDHEPYVGVPGEVHGQLNVFHCCCLDYVGGESVECAYVVRVGSW